MRIFATIFVVACVATKLLSIAYCGWAGDRCVAHAEPAPAFDRGLVERLIRAQERQAQALERLTAATERKCR